jgi:hypothetical protein
MSDKKTKIEKCLIVNEQPLAGNIVWCELDPAWPLPDAAASPGETRPTLILYIPYGDFETIKRLRKVALMNQAEAEQAYREKRQLIQAMKDAGIDLPPEVQKMAEGMEHHCDVCPKYDECDLDIKKPLKS